MEFVSSALASVVGAIVCWLGSEHLRPLVVALSWRGTKIDGVWEFYDAVPSQGVSSVGSVTFVQHGTKITAVSRRHTDRKGERTNREYESKGQFSARELVLIYQAIDRPDFRVGSIVLHLDQHAHILSGKTMTYDEPSQEVVAHPIWFRSTVTEKGADY
jgi:hypothetical protein